MNRKQLLALLEWIEARIAAQMVANSFGPHVRPTLDKAERLKNDLLENWPMMGWNDPQIRNPNE